MNEYMVEYDTIDFGWFECSYHGNNYKALILWVEEVLSAHGGGHADIFDEDGEFVEDVEV